MDKGQQAIQYRRRSDLLWASAESTPDRDHRLALLAAAKHFADLATALETAEKRTRH